MSVSKLRPFLPIDPERLTALNKILPEAFADGRINWDSLRLILGDSLEAEGPQAEHYGLTWPGKREARRLAGIPCRGALIPIPQEGVNHDTSNNLFIEGDNLEVLKLLKKSYAGKIKAIHLDPPYNTGADFVYADNYKDPLEGYLIESGQKTHEGDDLTSQRETGGRLHSKWLSMMYPRLLLARTLLKPDGIIIIHIDEHECTNLELLLKEIYGEENLLGTIIWDKRNPKGDATGIAYQHESIIICAKDKEAFVETGGFQKPKKNAAAIIEKSKQLFARLGKYASPSELETLVEKYDLPAGLLEKHRKKITIQQVNEEFSDWIKEQDFTGGEAAYCKIDDNGEVYRLVSMAWPNKKRAPDEYFIPLKHPVTGKDCPVPERGWRNPPKTMQDLLDKGQIIFGRDHTVQPQRKYLLRENMTENVSSLLPFGGSDDALLSNLSIPFDNPKPIEVLVRLLQSWSPEQNEIVLDFFAGSCSTAHALMKLNCETAVSRRFIMVQFQEPTSQGSIARKAGFENIAEIGKRRICGAIKELQKRAKSDSEKAQASALGFKYFKLTKSNYRAWNDYHGQSIPEVQTLFDKYESPLNDNWKQSDLLAEILLMEGFPLDSEAVRLKDFSKNKVYSITSDWCGYRLFACLDDTVYSETIKELQIGQEDVFACLDTALTDLSKLRLADKCNLKVI